MTTKKMVGHTKGDWIVGEPMVGGRVVVSVKGIGQIVKCYQCPESDGCRGMTEDEMMANARIIAAAPKMLDICKKLLKGQVSYNEVKRIIDSVSFVKEEKT